MDILHSLGIEPKLVITQIIGFAILLWIMNRLLYKPLFGTLAQRQADINATYQQLDDDRARMEETRRQYEQRLAGIEAEAREKIQAAVKEAQALRDNLVADAERQAESIVVQGRSENERERQAAFLEMRRQIVSLAMTAAGKVVGESLTDARQAKMVDDFIGSVGTGPKTAGVAQSANGSGSADQQKGAAAY
jgi:F-type H+-transporting ATPase subunit b